MFIRNVTLDRFYAAPNRIAPLDRGRLRLPPDLRAAFDRHVDVTMLWTRDDVHGSWLAGAALLSPQSSRDDIRRINARHLLGMKAQGVPKAERAKRKAEAEPFLARWRTPIGSDDRVPLPRKLRQLFVSDRVHLCADIDSPPAATSDIVLVLPSRPLLGFFHKSDPASDSTYQGYLYSGFWRPPIMLYGMPELSVVRAADKSKPNDPDYLLQAVTGVIGRAWARPGRKSGDVCLAVAFDAPSPASRFYADLVCTSGKGFALLLALTPHEEAVSPK